MDNIENSPCTTGDQKQSDTSFCFGCNNPIFDHFFLTTSSDTHFHQDCMKCSECGQVLDETKTCFLRNDKLLCKRDYTRLFGAKCGLCNCIFSHDELVMKTPGSIYHLDCFRCVVCSRVITKGEQFSNINNKIFCQMDYDVEVNKHQSTPTTITTTTSDGENFQEKKNFLEQNNNNNPTSTRPTHASRSSSSNNNNNTTTTTNNTNSNNNNPLKNETKTTRVRTVLNERQLHTLRTCYAVNPRPDALMKEQLVEMTGLNPRVIRVWFQNKRCKDKKRNIIFKQLRQQQDHDGVSDSVDPWLTNKGVPMVASSPVCHNSSASNSMLTSIEIQPHPVAAWKMEFNSNCMNNNNNNNNDSPSLHIDFKHHKLHHYNNYHDDAPAQLPHFTLPPQSDHHMFGQPHDDNNLEDDDTVVSLDDQGCLGLENKETLIMPSIGRSKKFLINNSPNHVYQPEVKHSKFKNKMSPEACYHGNIMNAQDSKCSYSSESNF